MATDQGRKVAAHWSRLAVTYEGALRSLASRGIAPEQAGANDLHAVDMIHMGGLAATDALAAMAGITAGGRVLDIGSGVGGPARAIASRFGAVVCGIELSEALHDTATRLTALVGLTGQVRLVHGSALALPFDDGSFDVAVMQHVAMQITEKDRLFAEAARVVKPGGCLALHELFAGEGELHYPLPWATEPGMSALDLLPTCIERLSGLGFEVGEFVDQSEEGRRFHLASIATYDQALAAKKGALGLTRDATEARRAASVAMERNLGSGSIKVGMIVARKRT
ncbi:class I SAM-dependent methyltransferase [Elioraea sp.]|uniref:class I SAM-dependent methyltransferase n=1 Tax=Elioraea sp. TaxID=2185103 RepID=UPI003F72892D